MEGNYIPPMSERRELSMSKFSLWLTYSTCKNAKKKTTIKKINVCQLHNKCAITSMDDNETSSFGNRNLQSCSRPVIPRIGCCMWAVYIRFICIHNWSPFFPICSDSMQVLDSEWPDIVSFRDKLSVIRSLLPPTIQNVPKLKHEYLEATCNWSSEYTGNLGRVPVFITHTYSEN